MTGTYFAKVGEQQTYFFVSDLEAVLPVFVELTQPADEILYAVVFVV